MGKDNRDSQDNIYVEVREDKHLSGKIGLSTNVIVIPLQNKTFVPAENLQQRRSLDLIL